MVQVLGVAIGKARSPKVDLLVDGTTYVAGLHDGLCPVVKFSRNAVLASLAGIPPPPVGVPARSGTSSTLIPDFRVPPSTFE